MKCKSKFWPLDYDQDDEIYENLAWDLPGLRPAPKNALSHKRSSLGAGAAEDLRTLR